MKITKCNIDFINNQNGLIGFAKLTIDNKLYLSSIGIHRKLNGNGYRLTYPQKQNREIFYPINKDVTKIIEKAIFDKLKDVIKNDRYCNNISKRR